MSGHENGLDPDVKRALELILPSGADFSDKVCEPDTEEHVVQDSREIPMADPATPFHDDGETTLVITLELPEVTKRRFNRARAATLGTAALVSVGAVVAALTLFDTPRKTHPVPVPQLTTPKKIPSKSSLTPQTDQRKPANEQSKPSNSNQPQAIQKSSGNSVSTKPESTVQYTAPVTTARQQAAPPVTRTGRTANTAPVKPITNSSSSNITTVATESGGAAPSGIEAPVAGSGGDTYGNGKAQPSGGVTPTIR